ncbi:MAG: hypothetical protein M3Z37_01465, partial [Candidatus Eremiobacteraeota bacterium]|nr:hypothetical protein [Candidatus Eremiobacteraeota bacterium]
MMVRRWFPRMGPCKKPWLTISAVIAWACTSLPGPCGSGDAIAARSGDAALAAIAQHYYRQTWRFEPDVASETGVHDYDAQLGSFAAGDFERDDRDLQATLSQLDAVQDAGLTLDGSLDRQILINAIKARLFYRITWPEWRLRPGFYNDIVSNAIFQLAARR